MGDRVVVLSLLPLDSVELRREVGTAVLQIVALLKGHISTPVANLNVALEVRNVDHGLVELETNLDRLKRTGGLLVERTIDELGPLLLGELLDVSTARKLGVIGDVGRCELDFGLLLGCRVGRGAVGGEGVREELAIILLDRGRKRLVGAQEVVCNAQSLLRAGRKRRGESDPNVLAGTTQERLDGGLGDKWIRITDPADSTSTGSTTNGPDSAFLRSLTSKPPRRENCSCVKGRR